MRLLAQCFFRFFDTNFKINKAFSIPIRLLVKKLPDIYTDATANRRLTTSFLFLIHDKTGHILHQSEELPVGLEILIKAELKLRKGYIL